MVSGGILPHNISFVNTLSWNTFSSELYSWHMLPFNLYFAWAAWRRLQPLDHYFKFPPWVNSEFKRVQKLLVWLDYVKISDI